MSYLKFSLLALALVLCAGHAHALDSIYSPNAESGELEFEYSGSRTVDRAAAKDGNYEHELAAEFGVGERTMVELAGELEKEPDEGSKFAKFGIETRFQFFEQGENWVDTGLLLAYNVALQKQSPDAIEVKLLLEKDFGKFTSMANIGMELDMGRDSNPDGPEYSMAMNTRYRWLESFEPAIELQSTFGHGDTVNHFDQQEHYIGPAAFGKLFSNVKYEAAYLLGFSQAASQGAARIKLKYEMAL